MDKFYRYYRQENNFDAFRELVKTCVKESMNQIFNSPSIDDPHFITFSPYKSELHDPIKQEIYEPKVDNYLNIILIYIYNARCKIKLKECSYFHRAKKKIDR